METPNLDRARFPTREEAKACGAELTRLRASAAAAEECIDTLKHYHGYKCGLGACMACMAIFRYDAAKEKTDAK